FLAFSQAKRITQVDDFAISLVRFVHMAILPSALSVETCNLGCDRQGAWRVRHLFHGRASCFRHLVPVNLASANSLTKCVLKQASHTCWIRISNDDLSRKPAKQFTKELEGFAVVD